MSRRRRVWTSLQWSTVLWLTLVWVALWGDLSVANVVSGIVIAVLVIVVFPLPPLEFAGRVRPLALAWLAIRFVGDLVVASVRVAGLALGPRRTLHGAMIEVPLVSRSDLHLLLTAELISLVPGTLFVEAVRRERVLFLHVLDVRSRADIEAARQSAFDQEWRVVHALGSDEQVETFRALRSSARPDRSEGSA